MMTFSCIFDGPQVAKTCKNCLNSSKFLLRPGRLLELFLDHFGSQKSPKMEPKTFSKIHKKNQCENHRKNDAQMHAKTEPKGTPGRPKPPTICRQNPDMDQGTPRDHKKKQK